MSTIGSANIDVTATGIEAVIRRLEEAEARVKRLEDADARIKGLEQAAAETAALAQRLADAEAKLKAIDDAAKDAASAMTEVSEATEEVAKETENAAEAAKELKEAVEEVAEAEKKVEEAARDAGAAVQNAAEKASDQRPAQGFAAQAEGLGKVLNRARGLASPFAAAAAAGFAAGTLIFKTYESVAGVLESAESKAKKFREELEATSKGNVEQNFTAIADKVQELSNVLANTSNSFETFALFGRTRGQIRQEIDELEKGLVAIQQLRTAARERERAEAEKQRQEEAAKQAEALAEQQRASRKALDEQLDDLRQSLLDEEEAAIFADRRRREKLNEQFGDTATDEQVAAAREILDRKLALELEAIRKRREAEREATEQASRERIEAARREAEEVAKFYQQAARDVQTAFARALDQRAANSQLEGQIDQLIGLVREINLNGGRP